MSATVISNDIDVQRYRGPLALPLGAVLATAGSLGYIAMNGLTPREASLHPVGVAGTMSAALGCLILSLALVQWRTALPRWTILTSAAGIWFAGAVAWSHSTVIVAAATKTSNQEFDDLFFGDPWVLGGMAPKSVLCLIGFLGIALAGWRTHAVPRSAVGLFLLAGVVSMWPPFPPGLILVALALILVARAESRAGRVVTSRD